jgi:hypothetical protein
MNNLNTLFFFTLTFTSLITLRGLTKLVGALLQGQPLVMIFSNRELIIFGLSISYIITYIFNK